MDQGSSQYQYGLDSLNLYYKQGKFKEEQFKKIKEGMDFISNTLNEMLDNQTKLYNTNYHLRKMAQHLTAQYDDARKSQQESIRRSQDLSRIFKTAETTYQSYRNQAANKQTELKELQNQLQQKQNLNEKQKMEDEELWRNKFDKQEKQIQNIQSQIRKLKTSIENVQLSLQDKNYKSNELRKMIDEKNSIIVKNIQTRDSIKDNPEHHASTTKTLSEQLNTMLITLKQLEEQIQRKQNLKIENQKKKKTIEDRRDQYAKILKQQKIKIEDEEREIVQIKNKINQIVEEKAQKSQLKAEQMIDLNRIQSEIKRQKDMINFKKKQTDRKKKEYKKIESNLNKCKDQIREMQMSYDKCKKQISDINNEIQNQQNNILNLKVQTLGYMKKHQDLKSKSTLQEAHKIQIQQQIQKAEKRLKDLKTSVAEIQKNVKQLTAQRQKMARKASSANSQVRQTAEELKVKQLLILDLTKKYQQTQGCLQNYKALYDQVKSARNKYVTLIQNSSQDLAQLKERIKILDNQLDILKNQSSQKDKTLQQYNRLLRVQIHKRDHMKAQLNKMNHKKKEKKDMVDQNINEIEKLNMIIILLQKDMSNLRHDYDMVCQSRNLTGIQLIDRNDQLCILYEKANIQQTVIRKGEIAVKTLEDDIRMIKIQISQLKRKIDVERKNISQVPKLADKVIQLQNQLALQAQQQEKLSKELENPQNKQRWNDLGGQPQDQQTLNAKINILEQRLNSKKQQLLQKQLILDQITNLSEKLRNQALEGRQQTLSLSQQLNNQQRMLKQLTRKMKATIAQLSMFQANSINLQHQRDKLQQIVQQAQGRFQQGLPPTPQMEIEYLKKIRDNKRHQEERKIRLQKQALQKNYPPFGVKTTAQNRVNAYIQNELGLPVPYGYFSPFKPQQLGANMRHIRKPKIPQIQI